MNRKPTILRHWLATLLAAVCIPLGTQTAWADDDPFYAARTARTNNTFTFSQPAYNVETTVEYVDAKVSLTTDNDGTLYYLTLAEAIADADYGEIVTLLDNVTITEGLTINKEALVINLGGKTLTYTGTGAVLEITDISAAIISSGTITCTGDNSTGIINSGVLSLSGVAITCSGSTATGINNTGQLVFSSGSITCEGTTSIGILNNNTGEVTVNSGSISCTGASSDGIYNYGSPSTIATLKVMGGSISGTMTGIDNNGTLTVTGGNISSTNGYAINHIGTTFNLSGAPSLSGTTADIYLNTDKIITINAALTAPTTGETPVADPWTVASNNIGTDATTPYIFTSGFSTNCLDGSNVADPASYFACTTEGITTRLASNEAQFVQYISLDADVAETVPVIINNGQTDDGTRAASLDEGNVWVGDQLSVTTTATPGITWQWYRVSGTTETAISEATASTYTLTAEDVGKTIIAKATQPMNIAGTGYPASDVVVATAATVAVVKKDNFGTLAAIAAPTMDYIGVEITPVAGVEYLVVADGVAPTAAQWELATTPTADEVTAASLTITQFAAVSGETASLSQMMPGTAYDLYYRLVETDDTKAGTTDETYGKSVNEKNTDIATLEFNRQVTIEGVTYLIEDDTNDNTTAATAKIIGLPAVDDAEHAGHKTAHAYASIPKTAFTAHEQEVFSVIGYTLTDATSVTDVDWYMNISSVGNAVGSYGYLTIDYEDLYGALANTTLVQASPEGYQIFNWNNGEAFYVLGKTVSNKVVYEMAQQNKGLTDNLTAALNAVQTGGSVKFYNPDDTELPVGTTSPNVGKPVAADGQTVKVVVALPDGFEFISGKNVVTVQNVAGDITLTLDAGTGVHAGKYVGTFTMPSQMTSAVDFKELVETTKAPIQGRVITVTVNAPTDGSGTVTPDGGNPTGDNIRIFSVMKYTLTPTAPAANAEGAGYALTSLGLSDGITATIKNIPTSGDPQEVELPYDGAVTVEFTIPATYTENTVVFTPVFTNTYENIKFAAGGTTYYDSKGLALHGTNDNLTFYTVTGVSETGASLTEIATKKIPSGKPVIVSNATAGDIYARMDIAYTEDLITDYSTAFTADLGTATVFSGFRGTDVDRTIVFSDSYTYYGFDGTFFVKLKPGGGNSVAAHRCWLRIEIGGTGGSSARQLSVAWPYGSTTRINGVNADDEDGDWYDLNGRKLQAKPQRKGVYILNGQKKVVK